MAGAADGVLVSALNSRPTGQKCNGNSDLGGDQRQQAFALLDRRPLARQASENHDVYTQVRSQFAIFGTFEPEGSDTAEHLSANNGAATLSRCIDAANCAQQLVAGSSKIGVTIDRRIC